MAGSNLSIGAVARQAGLRASALRFYEREGLLPRAARSGGKRIYADSILERLEVIEFAKECGFRLEEIRRLLHGAPGERVSARWQTLVSSAIQSENFSLTNSPTPRPRVDRECVESLRRPCDRQLRSCCQVVAVGLAADQTGCWPRGHIPACGTAQTSERRVPLCR